MLLFCPEILFAASNNYAGAVGGFAILSGDGRTIVGGRGTTVSLYKPQTGAAFTLFVGRHLSDYFSIQANYIWNTNDLTLTSASFSPMGEVSYQETRGSSQFSFIGDALVYFRNRRSWIRPYLSAGAGITHLSSHQHRIVSLIGPASLPAEQFTANNLALRVAVGADLTLHHGWWFRYSFSETLTSNSISQHLTPPGQGNLKDFQNLFGLLKTF
jgi:hypothetical protein